MASRWGKVWQWLRRQPDADRARDLFWRSRASLQKEFFQAVATSGKPRGLIWKGCEWSSSMEMARERASGKLVVLVGVTIQFQAVEGSDMEGLPAVDNLRNASAVFFFEGGKWQTTGKTLFNLNPDEALDRLVDHYERLSSGKG